MNIVPGYTTEQKVVTVANNDAAMNAVIASEATGNWLVVPPLTPSGSDIIILFVRTILDVV